MNVDTTNEDIPWLAVSPSEESWFRVYPINASSLVAFLLVSNRLATRRLAVVIASMSL